MIKTQVQTDQTCVVVKISGYLSFDSGVELEAQLHKVASSFQDKTVLVDLEHLHFVGSTGVSTFVKSLKSLNKLKTKPIYTNVKSEFLRLFKAFEQEDTFAVSENLAEAKLAAVARYAQWEMETLRTKASH